MSEILKLLEENIEEYDIQLRNARRYLQENEEEFSPNYAYAKRLEMPLRKNQFFFYCKAGQPGADLLHALYDSLSVMAPKGSVFLYRGEKPGENCEGTGKDTNKYWAALARSGYVIANTQMPDTYVKREGQIYFNPMSVAFQRENARDARMISVLYREFLRTDVTLAPDAETARDLWEKKTGLLGLYQGRILLCANPVEKAAAISEILLAAGRGERIAPSAASGVDVLAAAEPRKSGQERKKILVLTSWKAPREHKYVIRYVLNRLAALEYDVTVLAPLTEKNSQILDFARLPGIPAVMMYGGSLPMDREEILAERIVERNPQAYQGNPEIRAFLDGLMKQEWRRIWGKSPEFDVGLVLGAQGWQSYYLAMTGNFRKRILVDLDYLEKSREKAPAEWNRAAAGFDEIICLPSGKGLGGCGAENKARVRYLPVAGCKESASVILSANASFEAREGKLLELEGQEYVVCDAWRGKDGWRLTLLKLPAPGTILGRDSFRADPELWKYLFLLPAAGVFFARLGGCVRNPDLEYDAAAEICKAWGVPILPPEKGKGASPS